MITDKELRKILKNACDKAGSQRKWALDNGLSPAYVNDMLQENRKLGKKILKVLRYKKVEVYAKEND